MQESNQDIFDIIDEAESLEVPVFVTFEPFSFIILQELQKLRTIKEKNRLYYSILTDPRAELINETNGKITTLFPNHNTSDDYWGETKLMAKVLNENGYNVCFLPEDGDTPKSTKRADAILNYDKNWQIADFKYFHSTKENTLTKDLKNGFLQASTIVLKITNADTGVFKESIEYLKRNDLKFGNIILINEYDKVLEIKRRQFESDKYKYLLKGFL